MERVKKGYIGGAFKPFHQGHFLLLKTAASSVDVLQLFVSTKDRENISWNQMKQIWELYLLKILPSNVVVSYSKESPVKDIYVSLKENQTKETAVVFCDDNDVWKYSSKKIGLFVEPTNIEFVKCVGFSRLTDTCDISGTQMRLYLKTRQKELFVAGLPEELTSTAKNEIWSLLTA